MYREVRIAYIAWIWRKSCPRKLNFTQTENNSQQASAKFRHDEAMKLNYDAKKMGQRCSTIGPPNKLLINVHKIARSFYIVQPDIPNELCSSWVSLLFL